MKLWTTNRKTSCLAAHYYKKKKKMWSKETVLTFKNMCDTDIIILLQSWMYTHKKNLRIH